MTAHQFENVAEAHSIVRQMTQDGEGPTAIARVLNARGLRNSRGTAWSVQRVHQLMESLAPGPAAVAEMERCRRGVDRAVTRLYRTAAHDPKAAVLHGVYMQERAEGRDLFAAVDKVLASV